MTNTKKDVIIPKPWAEMTPAEQQEAYEKLQGEIIELTAKLEAAEEHIGQAVEFNTQLQAEIEKMKAAGGTSSHVVQLGDQMYRVVIPSFIHKKRGKLKASDIEDNSELLKELIEMESGVIELIPGKESEE